MDILIPSYIADVDRQAYIRGYYQAATRSRLSLAYLVLQRVSKQTLDDPALAADVAAELEEIRAVLGFDPDRPSRATAVPAGSI
jgi:hypothetical protein